ncbi:MAG: ParB N-terminal domain-containing protein [Eubacteriales bacterium]|nr:ParB N-terminal domain-containing protein [Eubacteriales bacterium]
MPKHHNWEDKLEAVRYYNTHNELSLEQCAQKYQISRQTLSRWQKQLREDGYTENARSPDATRTLDIPLDKLFPSELHNAIYGANTPCYEATYLLEQNIRELGLLQPLIVYPEKSGRYIITSGVRRWIALRNLDRASAKCIVLSKPLSKEEELERIIISNAVNRTMSISVDFNFHAQKATSCENQISKLEKAIINGNTQSMIDDWKRILDQLKQTLLQYCQFSECRSSEFSDFFYGLESDETYQLTGVLRANSSKGSCTQKRNSQSSDDCFSEFSKYFKLSAKKNGRAEDPLKNNTYDEYSYAEEDDINSYFPDSCTYQDNNRSWDDSYIEDDDPDDYYD